MSKLIIKNTLLIIVLAFISLSVSAQGTDSVASPKKEFKSHLYVTSSIGANILTGDINKIKPGFDFNLGLGWQFNKYLSVKGNFGAGLLRGGRTGENGFNIYHGNYIEGNFSLNLSLIDLIAGYNPDRVVSLTPHVGIGRFEYRLKTANDDGTKTNVGIMLNIVNDADEIYQGKGYKERYSVMEVPMGLELGFRMSNRWDLYLDCTTTWTNSDFVDAHIIGGNNDWITTFNLGAKHRILRDPVREAAKGYCDNWFISLEGGPFYSLGDVRKIPLFKDTEYNINLVGGYKWGRCWKVYGKIGYAAFTQDVRDNTTDEVVYTCDKGNLINANINIGMDIINCIVYKKDRLVSLYAHVGIGAIQYRSEGTYLKHFWGRPQYVGDKVYYGYSEYDNDQFHLSGNGFGGRRIIAELPVGFELSFRINEHWDIYGDGIVSFYDSDLVNGIVSGTWCDWACMGNIGVRYNFKKNCPAIEEEEKPTPQIVPEEPDIVPPPIIKRFVTREDEVKVIFHVNRTSLYIPENEKALADFVERIGDMKIKTVRIMAYASPEGSTEWNNKLAEGRAKAAKEFLMDKLSENVKDAEFLVESGGPDWEGFMKALEQSDIKNKDEIADVLNKANPATKYRTLYNISVRQPEVKQLYVTLRRSAIRVKIIVTRE